jgi:NADPH:quinone reductase-like Zn-dependent oxidoreductase
MHNPTIKQPNIKKMKAVILPAYNKNVLRAMLSLKVEEIPIPIPQKDEVLIKIEATPCNPSDIAFLQGGYNIVKTLPSIPGFEGAGTVVSTGDSAEAKKLFKKKVSCFTQEDSHGTWAEYFVTKANNCIPVDEKMEIEQAACFAINPFTAYGLYETARKNTSPAIILNAAAGQVARFVQVLAKANNINVINIVRKKEQIDELIELGEKYVLNSNDDDFEKDLKETAHLLNATTAFDAVGGDLSGKILNSMPSKSELIVYGGLSAKPISEVGVLDIIFKNKIISGFNLNQWIETKINIGKFQRISEELQQMIIKGEMKTVIQKTYKFDNVIKGMRQYLSNMSGGKILFVP